MDRFQSRPRHIQRPAQQIFELFSDFSVFSGRIPRDRIKGWEADADGCRFQTDETGEVSVRVVERVPYERIRASLDTMFARGISLQINLSAVASGETEVSLELQAELNPVVRMMAGGKIHAFLDRIADGLEAL